MTSHKKRPDDLRSDRWFGVADRRSFSLAGPRPDRYNQRSSVAS
jgi:hypothetical protein